jgi:hypothetical protein
MKPRLFAACILFLIALAACVQAQQAEPGADSTQLSPASAAPRTHVQPNLRTDSMPHTYEDPSTDSDPAPETLGVDAMPVVDLGWDWSLPQDSDQPSVLRRIVTRKGITSVVDVQTLPVVPLPVTNPPDPLSRIIADIPQPTVTLKPPPPDPLAGLPQ